MEAKMILLVEDNPSDVDLTKEGARQEQRGERTRGGEGRPRGTGLPLRNGCPGGTGHLGPARDRPAGSAAAEGGRPDGPKDHQNG